MAHTGTGIHVVVAKRGAHQLLHEERLLVGAARRGNAADGVPPVGGLESAELAGRVCDGLLPSDLAPRLVDRSADHRRRDAIGMGCVAERKATLHARMAVIGMTVAIGNHANDVIPLDLGLEGAANPTVSARRRYHAIGRARCDQGLFSQRDRRTRLYAGAARYTLGREERLVLAGGDLGRKAAPLNGQREGSLRFVT